MCAKLNDQLICTGMKSLEVSHNVSLHAIFDKRLGKRCDNVNSYDSGFRICISPINTSIITVIL
jgi:hypothetical protein